MDIRFVSSLTPEDESLVSPALLASICHILNLLPIAYTLRIEASGGQVFQQTGPPTAHAIMGRSPEALTES